MSATGVVEAPFAAEAAEVLAALGADGDQGLSVEDADRCGFAYGTLEGHPVTGEEAYIVTRRPDGSVWLTIRSLTRPGRGAWRAAYPAALVAQAVYRRRYVRALRP